MVYTCPYCAGLFSGDVPKGSVVICPHCHRQLRWAFVDEEVPPLPPENSSETLGRWLVSGALTFAALVGLAFLAIVMVGMGKGCLGQ